MTNPGKKTDEIAKDKLDKVSGGQIPPITATVAIDPLRDLKRTHTSVDVPAAPTLPKDILNRP